MVVLHAETIRVAILGVLAMAFLGLVIAVLRLRPIEPELFAVIVVLAIVGGSAWIAYRARPLSAANCLVGGLVMSLVLALVILPAHLVAPWLSAVVLVGSALLGWRRGAAAAIVVSGALLHAAERRWIPLTGDDALNASLLGATVWFLSWLTSRPAQTAFAWATNSYL